MSDDSRYDLGYLAFTLGYSCQNADNIIKQQSHQDGVHIHERIPKACSYAQQIC